MGLFRIGTAARMVGVEVATLRNWEQRYSVVLARRSPGRQRLYSHDEIERLRAVKSWIDQGLSAGEAHNLLRQGAPLNRAGADRLPGWRVRSEARRVRAEAAATQARAAATHAHAARQLEALAEGFARREGRK